MVRRRQSIHPEEKRDEVDKSSEVFNCSLCEKTYFVHEDKTQTELDEDSCKQWQDLQEKKKSAAARPGENLEGLFTCAVCEGAHSVRSSAAPSIYIHPVWIVIIAAIAIPLMIKLSSFFYNSEKPFDVNIYNQTQAEIIFEDELYGLEDSYKRQEEKVWYTLAAGIKSVLREKPNQPSVFLLLFDSESAGNTAKCLAHDVIKPATKYLMNRSKDPVVYSGAQLKNNNLLDDPGLLLVLLNDTVREKGAMVVTDLQDVPPIVATSFHFFCDRYSPLIERAVYFFTLKVEQIEKTLQRTAEKKLNQLWSQEMPDNKLQPLITRMTSNILRIFSDVSC